MDTLSEGGSWSYRTTMRSSSLLTCMRAGFTSLIKLDELATLIIFSVSYRITLAVVASLKLL